MRQRTTSAEQRKMEELLAASDARLRALLEAAVDSIISIDARAVIQTINPAAERMFGYAEHEVIGQSVQMLMPSPVWEERDGYLARYPASSGKWLSDLGQEGLGQRKGGATFPIDLSMAEARLGDECIFVSIIRDITERKETEEELRQSKEALEKTVAELEAKNAEIRAMSQQLWHAAKLASVGELAASIAHELNNPLATVSLRVEFALARLAEDGPVRRALEIIGQETERMGDLVANLLQFARRGQEQISTLDVRQELTRSVELIQHHLRKQQVTVVQEFAPDTPTIYADRQKLRQVFLNLLTNASDAMPHGGTLTLHTAPATLDDGRAAVLIEVTDSGVGIPAENLEKIMEPFFTTKEEGKGTGLGLPICRRVVHEHHGTMQIASDPAKGTTVRILLPVRNGANVDRLNSGGLVN